MYVMDPELEALRIMAFHGGSRPVKEWRALGMVDGMRKCQVLASLGLAEKRGGFAVRYGITAEGVAWLEREGAA